MCVKVKSRRDCDRGQSESATSGRIRARKGTRELSGALKMFGVYLGGTRGKFVEPWG